jgi:anaerobic C4-dicarboxylate transporter DcuA
MDEKPEKVITKQAKYSVYIFLSGIVALIFFGIFPEILPQAVVLGENGKRTFIGSGELVQIFMYLTAFINLFLWKIDYREILKSKITQSSVGAAAVVFCLGWVGTTIFNYEPNAKALVDSLGDLITSNILITIILAIVISAILGAQTVVASILFPLLLSLGFPAILVPVIVQTLDAKFIIPAQPTLIFACELDETGETKPYSFLVPGFIVLFITLGLSFVLKAIVA